MTTRDEWRWTDERGVQRLVGTEELRAALSSSLLPASTLVWRDGMKEWAPASTMPELAAAIAAAVAKSPQMKSTPTLVGSPEPPASELAGSGARPPRPKGSGAGPLVLPSPAARRPAAPPIPARGTMRTLVGVTAEEADRAAARGAPIMVPSPSTARASITQIPQEGTSPARGDALEIPKAPAMPGDAEKPRPSPQRKMTTREIDSDWSSVVIGDEDATELQLTRPTHEELAKGSVASHEATAALVDASPAGAMPATPKPSDVIDPAAGPARPPNRAAAGSAIAPATPKAAAPIRPAAPPVRPAPHRPPVPTRALAPKPPTKPTAPAPVIPAPPPTPSFDVDLDALSETTEPTTEGRPPLADRATSASAAGPTRVDASPSPPLAAPAPLPLELGTSRPSRSSRPPPKPSRISYPPPLPDSASATTTALLRQGALPEAQLPPPRAPLPSHGSLQNDPARLPLPSHGSLPNDPARPPLPSHGSLPNDSARASHPSYPPPLPPEQPRPPTPSRPPPPSIDPLPPPREPPQRDESPQRSDGSPPRDSTRPPASASARPSSPPRASDRPSSPPSSSGAPTARRKTSDAPPPPLRGVPVAVPVSSLYSAGGALICMVVTAFFAGRCSAQAPPQVARPSLQTIPILARAAIPAPPKACWVTRQPVMWAPKASKTIPFEVTPTAASGLAVGYARDAKEAMGIVVSLSSGEVKAAFEQNASEDIDRVTPSSSGEFRVVTAAKEGALSSVIPVAAPTPFVLGVQGGSIVAADHEGDATSALWPLAGTEAPNSARVQIAPQHGYGLVFRREGAIWTGFLGVDRKPAGPLIKLVGSGGQVGKPNLGWNGRELAAIFADKPSENDHYEIRIAHAGAGVTPAETRVIPLPKGGPGGDAFAPDIAGLADGRWVMVWTEGDAGSRAIRAQTFDHDFTPLGDPIALSPPAGNFGQGVLGVAGAYAAAVFLSKGASSYELWGSVLQCE